MEPEKCLHSEGVVSSAQWLIGEDALTYNGLLQRFPGWSIRLAHAAAHTIGRDEHDHEDWEQVITGSPGWRRARCHPAAEAQAHALRMFEAVIYGAGDPPGHFHSAGTEPEGRFQNRAISVLCVGEKSFAV